jgi:hypothetical protein
MYTYCQRLALLMSSRLRNNSQLSVSVTSDDAAETLKRLQGTASLRAFFREIHPTLCKHQCHQIQPPGQWRSFVISSLEDRLSSVGGDRYISALALFWNRLLVSCTTSWNLDRGSTPRARYLNRTLCHCMPARR